MKGFLKPTKIKRFLFFIVLDIFFIIFSFCFSFYLRFGFTFPQKYHQLFLYWVGGFVIINVILLFLAGLYNISWRFVGLAELYNLCKIAIVSFIAFYLINFFIRKNFTGFDLPRGIIIITIFLSFIFVGLLRISKRLYLQVFMNRKIGKKVLIIGSEQNVASLIKEMRYNSDDTLIPMAIVDDDHMRIGTKVEGVPIIGGINDIHKIINDLKIESVLINFPKATHKYIGEIFNLIKKTGVDDIKIVPQIDEYESKVNRLRAFKQISIEDLLSREPVQIEIKKIEAYLKNKTILVTGAAGSIGSEIIKQLIRFKIGRVIGFEIDETEVFNLKAEIDFFKKSWQSIEFVIGDIRDKNKLEQVIKELNPQIIFHSAAYKHVPLMEKYPDEAIKTNVFGTLNLVEMASKYKIDKFINISTDKAVNPTSVMGASKRISEIICAVHNSKITKMISVRFGNVLGSRGSVIPVFLSQIEKGGPVRITHKDMKRYFMDVNEAVLLVFQACLMGKGGEVFVLDMGDPIKIVDLAKTLIVLNKLEPFKDIDIVFTGLRPGEKLFEELLTAEEGTDVTCHEKIFIARNGCQFKPRRLKLVLKELKKSISRPEEISNVLRKYIPYYRVH